MEEHARLSFALHSEIHLCSSCRPTISSSSVSSLRWQRTIALFEPVWFAGPIIFSVCCLCGTELCRGGGCLRDTFPLRWQWQCWWQHPNYIDNGDIVGQFWDIIQSFLVLKTATCDYTKVDGDLCLSNRVSQNKRLFVVCPPPEQEKSMQRCPSVQISPNYY